jgi:hypothetical protein
MEGGNHGGRELDCQAGCRLGQTSTSPKSLDSAWYLSDFATW